MQIDLEDVSSGGTFESEVCVIGAGIAGLLLSRKLAEYGHHVNLLEAGGINLEQRSQDLYKSEMRGVLHKGTTEGRFRTFGGASTRWGGQLLSYPDEVFEEREITGYRGWPISESDIWAYYPEIFRAMGVNDLPFTDQVLERFGTRTALSSPDVRVRLSKFAPFSKRNLGKTVGKECCSSRRVMVFFHANAVSINLDQDCTGVESVTVRNYKGREYQFKARQYVISTGTIEASRLLLSSNNRQKCGVGNATDLVGRYFHDHVSVKAASLGPSSMKTFVRYLAPYYIGTTLHSPKLEATSDLQQRLSLLAVMAQLYIHEGENEFGRLREMLVKLQRREFDIKNVVQMPSMLRGAARMAFSLKVKGRRLVSSDATVTMNIETEQAPRLDSRIQISDRLNVLGVPEAIVDWKVSMAEGETLYRYALAIDTYLKSLGIPEITWDPNLMDGPAAWVSAASDMLHPMGGTCMGNSPETSVVDKNLCIHGASNLSIASCSVFPTGGSSNPTFTMMALACRLADRLHNSLGG